MTIYISNFFCFAFLLPTFQSRVSFLSFSMCMSPNPANSSLSNFQTSGTPNSLFFSKINFSTSAPFTLTSLLHFLDPTFSGSRVSCTQPSSRFTLFFSMPPKVAFLGPLGTYTHQVCLRGNFFPFSFFSSFFFAHFPMFSSRFTNSRL